MAPIGMLCVFHNALCGTFYFESLVDKVFLKNILLVSEEDRVRAQVSEGSRFRALVSEERRVKAQVSEEGRFRAQVPEGTF